VDAIIELEKYLAREFENIPGEKIFKYFMENRTLLVDWTKSMLMLLR
jgi:hypothetical protein